MLAFASLASESIIGAAGLAQDGTVDQRKLDHPARAKRVIFLYMPGGPSHVDLLDPKSRLIVDNVFLTPSSGIDLVRGVAGTGRGDS